jgi:hypothetical protein
MSHRLGFDILPFDWKSTQQVEIQIPIDLDDFAHSLQAVYPAGEINLFKHEDSTTVRLYISVEQYGPWMVAQLAQGKNTILDVSAWPKLLAIKIILWYRQYINLKYPLFLIVSDTGEGIELRSDTSQQEIENVYPPQWVLQEWKEA